MTQAAETLLHTSRRHRLPDHPIRTRAGRILRILAATLTGTWVVLTMVDSVRADPVSPWAPSLESLVAVDGVRHESRGELFMTSVLDLTVDTAANRAGLRLMERSKRDAQTAALQCLQISEPARPKIRITSGGIAGPSAGLMFALEIIDRVGWRDIARGRRIAGTGTIAQDGTVGEVGGIVPKVLAAEEVRADVFLVPAAQVDVAAGAAITVDVIGVRDLDEALRVLGGRGCSWEA